VIGPTTGSKQATSQQHKRGEDKGILKMVAAHAREVLEGCRLNADILVTHAILSVIQSNS
jgi:hypothetical protein